MVDIKAQSRLPLSILRMVFEHEGEFGLLPLNVYKASKKSRFAVFQSSRESRERDRESGTVTFHVFSLSALAASPSGLAFFLEFL